MQVSSSTRSLVDSDHLGPGGPEILIVDADPDSRAGLRELVEPLAHAIDVGSLENALPVGQTRERAAILIDLDLQPPDCDGLQILARLRESSTGRDVPALFLSHSSDPLAERRGDELGALGYLRKPVDPAALRAKLEVLLTLYQRGVELRRITAEARAKDVHMGMLGHDLRNPLSAILVSARIVLMRDMLTPEDRTSVARIARNAERMAALIRDLLDYTRGQSAGGIPIVRQPAHMGEICAAMIEDIALLHPERPIRMSASGKLRGSWDRGRVEQAISNLISNALTHGTGAVNLVVEGRRGEVAISVHNEGAPIPEDQLPHLFDPFSRGETSRLGLGLGLFIVREILRAHGGTVEVTTSVDHGTTFTTRWPRAVRSTRELET